MFTRTTTALLEDLVDPANDGVWRAFDDRYRPVLVAFGRRLGLSSEDAADAAQETLTRFVTAYRDGRYDRARGRLGAWIIGIARRCIGDQRRRRARDGRAVGISAADDLPDEARLTQVWEEERSTAILRHALESLRTESRLAPRTREAFEMLALHRVAPAQVADALGMTMNDVYLAKHRCLARLRDAVAATTVAWEEDA